MVLESLRFQFWDAPDMVEGLIKKWKPRGCKTEKQHENSLYEFLHSELEEVQVTKQSAKGRIRADNVVGDNVIVELKNNLNSTGKYQRLVGQLVEYEAWDGDVIVILCGKSGPEPSQKPEEIRGEQGVRVRRDVATLGKALIRHRFGRAEFAATPTTLPIHPPPEEHRRIGSHRQFKHATKPGRVTVPGKPSDDLAPGTQRSILKQAKIVER